MGESLRVCVCVCHIVFYVKGRRRRRDSFVPVVRCRCLFDGRHNNGGVSVPDEEKSSKQLMGIILVAVVVVVV